MERKMNCSQMLKSVVVLGAGSWGTCLAIHLARKGIECCLWARNDAVANSLKEVGENRKYLQGVRLPENLEITSSLKEALAGRDVILFVVPSHGFRQIANQANKILCANSQHNAVSAIVSCSKGIENETLLTMTGVMAEVMPRFQDRLSVLSGPSFADEVARELPAAVSVASKDEKTTQALQHLFATETFRVYGSSDIIGVEIGGALKNVMAIASGISDGLGFGTNARAALITRGLAEMTRMGVALGAQPRTFAGLAGIGDLVLTCTGDLSRNRHVGLRLGKGECLDEIVKSMSMVAEGVKTTRSAFFLASKHDVEMPITQSVYSILYEGKNPQQTVRELMTRPLVHE